MIVIKNRLDSHRQISQHFKANELECRCGKCSISIISDDLITRLEVLRRLWGKAVVITSAYRCQAHNEKIGGKAHSWHVSGHAADLLLPDKDRDLFIKLCSKVFNYSYVGEGFCHVDVRI